MAIMKDIAAAAGVSVATVSNAFNRPDRLSPDTLQQVLEVARTLGYGGPHAVASSLRTGSVGAIGVVLSDGLSYAVQDPGSLLLLQGIARATDTASTVLSVFPIGGPDPVEPSGADRALSMLQRGVVDGFVVFNLPDDHRAIRAVASRGAPFVTVDAPRLHSVAWIGIDERAAAKAAAEHLLELGHRDIGIVVDRLSPDGVRGPVGWPRVANARDLVGRERVRGYVEALGARDVPLADVPVVEAGGFSPDAAHEAARALLSIRPGLTAVLASTDVLALGVLDVLREGGLVVPDHMSVVGFDDIPSADGHGLTTIRQPLEEKGRCAAEMLLEQTAGRPVESLTLPWSLVVRGTTAAPRRSGSAKRGTRKLAVSST